MLRFDGGECGKFTYTGSLQVYCNKVLSCVLQGAHPNPCTFNPFKVARASSSYKGWFMLTKRGAGTWKMSGDSCYNSNFGGLMIEDGVLQMARIKAIGASSGGYTSCGWLTNVTQFCGYAYKGAVDDAPSPVGYAIRLGKADDLAQCGILEYIGNENVSCLNRAFALTGRGGFKNETDKNFIIGPIASEPLPEGGDAPVLNTLVLESSSASVNETRNITENAGAIRIEKRGTGTWILNENIGFTTSGLEVGAPLEPGASATVSVTFHYKDYQRVAESLNAVIDIHFGLIGGSAGGDGNEDEEITTDYETYISLFLNNQKGYGINDVEHKANVVLSNVKTNKVLYDRDNVTQGNLKHLLNEINTDQTSGLGFVFEYVSDTKLYLYTYESQYANEQNVNKNVVVHRATFTGTLNDQEKLIWKETDFVRGVAPIRYMTTPAGTTLYGLVIDDWTPSNRTE